MSEDNWKVCVFYSEWSLAIYTCALCHWYAQDTVIWVTYPVILLPVCYHCGNVLNIDPKQVIPQLHLRLLSFATSKKSRSQVNTRVRWPPGDHFGQFWLQGGCSCCHKILLATKTYFSSCDWSVTTVFPAFFGFSWKGVAGFWSQSGRKVVTICQVTVTTVTL